MKLIDCLIDWVLLGRKRLDSRNSNELNGVCSIIPIYLSWYNLSIEVGLVDWFSVWEIEVRKTLDKN